ncbi:MAG: hypothetical protein IAF94_15990 [Pirellulaceae bacterium]|nr:hypothetical protein [Pirellulaceae bacterium]
MRLHSTALSLGLVVSALTGCASLGTPKPDARVELSKAGTPVADTANTPTVNIIFQPESGRPERLEQPLTEATTVQQMLVQSGSYQKYRRIEVEIDRPLASGGFHKIPCEYDRETKQISPESDYALMPGDRVIVTQDTSTIIDDMMRAAGGNLGKRFTTGGKHKAANRYRVEG